MREIHKIAFAATIVSAAAWAAPVITNGDFSSGNTGFTTSATHTASPCATDTDLYPEGTYSVSANPNDCHNLYSSFGDHTTGTGLMLIVNGTTVAALPDVWIQTVTGWDLTHTYTLGLWARRAYFANPASLSFWIDDDAGFGSPTQLSPSLLVNSPSAWQQLTSDPFVPTATTMYVRIRNATNVAFGNDFAIDDISVRDLNAPEPATSLMIAAGLIGLALAGRRR
jgi:hypothetical protein